MIWRIARVWLNITVDLHEKGSTLGRSFRGPHVLTMFGSWQEVKQPFISVCLPRDNAASHRALVGSYATCMRAITESSDVIGVL